VITAALSYGLWLTGLLFWLSLGALLTYAVAIRVHDAMQDRRRRKAWEASLRKASDDATKLANSRKRAARIVRADAPLHDDMDSLFIG
jgi:hypothetical protein